MIVDIRTLPKTDFQVAQELFERQVDERPLHTAIVFRDQEWTYQEVEAEANQLARYLRSKGVGTGSLVAIYFDRSELPVISILATLKAGAAYVPIDPCQPPERAGQILSEAEVAVVLTEAALVDRVNEAFDGEMIVVDSQRDQIAMQSSQRLSVEETGTRSDDLCYVLYTSGTTGRPKGVMIEHRNVLGFVSALHQIFGLRPTDRVYHGFSLCFDASVEELWMAFSSGAALVIAPADVVRVPDEVAKLIEQEKITIISSVPTFLAILEPDLPSLRLVITGGEACPPELIQRWVRPGRRFMNTYGPTEATVDSTYVECEMDQPVTIGKALPGYETYVLDENLRQVEPGEPGELCIGGVGVARGYLKRPDLTADRFVPNPFSPATDHQVSDKIYRSGDLVRMTVDGDIEFMGRIDRQVKVRGFRIELGEIESVLNDNDQISQSIVEVIDSHGSKELAAYVVTQPHVNGSFDRQDVLARMRDRLPVYMVPSYLDVIEEIPTLPSGKADRSQLPKDCTPLVAEGGRCIEPASELEQQIHEVWQEMFKIDPISCDADFFQDLAGHSLLAAEMVSMLRNRHGHDVAIRDLYQNATVQKLALHIEQAEVEARVDTAKPSKPRRSSSEVFHSVPAWVRGCCYSLQAMSILLFYALASLPFLGVVLLTLNVLSGGASVWTLVAVMSALTVFGLPLSVTISVALKWLIIGRYKPGEYPLWSFYYFRWWFVGKVQSASGIGLFAGTPVVNLYYRLMGAKVGKNCIIDTPLCGMYDLISIGDDTCVNAQTHLLGYRVEDGLLKIGTIDIGERCFVGTHCCFGINTKMEDDSYLDDQSLLQDGEMIESGEARRGSPSQPCQITLPSVSEQHATRRHPILFGFLHYVGAIVVGNLLMLTAIPYLLLVTSAYVQWGVGWAVLSLFVSLPVSIVLFCLFVAAVKPLIHHKPKPGVYPVESLFFVRKWTVDVLLEMSSFAMYTMYSTIFLPQWLKLLGAKIGKGVEVATIGQFSPDLIEIGEGSFCADGSMVGGQRFFRGQVQIAMNHIGSHTFVGNSSLLPVGADLGDDCLLGVMSTAPEGACSKIADETEWLGSPPFPLPHRKKVEGFDTKSTYQPTAKLYFMRGCFDTMRMLLPISVGVNASVLHVWLISTAYYSLPTWALLLLVPASAMLVAFAIAMMVVAIKKVLMGRYVPIVEPLWSNYVWRNESFTGIYESLAAPVLAPLMGTPFISWYLRLLGCKIGKHCYLETTLFGEFDLVEIGDYAALNLGVVVQNHLFEDRIMKSSYLKIGDECSAGNMAVILYDTEMGPGSSIGSLSLLMKGESLPPRTRWVGLPTRQIRE